MNNKTKHKTKQKVLLIILISFFSVIFTVNCSSANYLDDHIRDVTGTDTIFANAACEATLGTDDAYFECNANYVTGGYIKPDQSVEAYYKKGQYCIENANGSGTGNFYVYNMIDLYPDGSVTVYHGDDDSAMKTFKNSDITRVVRQLAYLSKKSIENGEGKVTDIDCYKIAIQSLIGKEKAKFIEMGIDNRFYDTMGKIDEVEGKYQESLNAANSSTVYRARFMFIGKNGGQGLIIFGAKEVQEEIGTGNIRILKRDADTDKPLGGVTFILKNSAGKYVIAKNQAGQSIGSVTGNAYVYNIETTISRKSATKFITDSSGNITISNIPVDTYTLEEMSLGDNEYGYEIEEGNIEWEVNGKSQGNGVTVTLEVQKQSSNSTGSNITVTESNADTVKVKNIKQTGNIRILKRDADTDKPLAGVTFILKNSGGKYVIAKNQAGESIESVTGSTYLYNMETTTNKESATKFITDSSGNIIISNILADTYTLEEISLGNDEYGYEIGKGNIEWEVNGKSQGNGVTVTFEVQRQKIDESNATVTESNADTVKVKNIRQTGNIRILKRDAETDKPLAGVTFILKNSAEKYVIAKNKSGQSIGSVTGSVYIYDMETTTNKESATKFITDSSGNIIISNILTDTYTLEEISLGNDAYGYEIGKDNIEWEVNGKSQGKGVTVAFEVQRQKSDESNTTVTESNADTVKVKNIKQTGNIKIFKKDPDSKKALAKISFILQASNGQYVVAIDEKGKEVSQATGKIYLSNISYTKDINKATKFITDTNGVSIISNIIIDNYKIVEYSIGDAEKENYGYEIDDDYISWEVNGGSTGTGKEISITLNRQNANNTTSNANVTDSNSDAITVNNKRKYIKLSGYVWEDIHWEEGKNAYTNELYKDGSLDTEDKLLENVTVKLKDNSGKVLQSAVTDSKGSYLFEDIIIDNLENLYIEFTYNGMSYQCVSLIDLQKANASKSSEGNERQIFNEEYSTITKGQSNKHSLEYETGNYTSTLVLGNNLKYGYKGAKYPISGVYDQYEIQATTKNACNGGGLDKIKSPDEIRKNAINEVTDINLGVKEREQPDLAVVKDVYSAKVSLRGEEFTYLYEDRLKAENKDKDSVYNMNPQVKFGQERGSQTYTRALYASDIKYTGENEINVKVTYRIGIHNQSTNLKIRVNEIADYFDSKYDVNSAIAGTALSNDGTTPTGQVQILSKQEYNSEYSKVTINPNITLEPQTEAMIYLQLTVKKQNIVNIVDVGEEVKLDNITEVTSYSTLDQNGTVYAGIDVDSQPGNAVPGNKTTYEDDTDIAPGILIVLQDERATEGSVFEDGIREDLLDSKVRVGSGTYDEGELGIAGIGVVVKEEDGDIAQVYDAENGVWKDAVTVTDSSGSYHIGGFLPGTYHIIYTWGGQEYTLSDGTSKMITVQDYKGTIVDKGSYTAKSTNDEWYKNEFKQSYSGIEWNNTTNTEIRVSDAIDNYDQRQAIDNEIKDITYEKTQQIAEGNLIKTMESTTPGFKINLEYVDGPIDASEEYELNADGTVKMENGYVVKRDEYKNTLKSIDFGIVERPKQTVALGKYVKHIKVVLANGSTLFETDIDENGNLVDQPSYIVYIPESSGNNAQLKIEIDSEIVQGATLEVTYGFKVRNTGEIDYNTADYYFYGPGYGENSSDMVQLKVTEIIDYLDDEIAINMEANNQWNLLSEEELNNNYKGKLLANTTEMQDYLKTIKRKLTTDELSTVELKPGDENSELEIVTSKYLANNEETFIENYAEIIHVEKNGGSSLTTTPGNYVPTEASTSEVDNDNAEEVYITPPTGSTDNTISYVILTISTLSIFVAGIILIKRFVIK